jgi:large-conductance mechanosensitive channel
MENNKNIDTSGFVNFISNNNLLATVLVTILSTNIIEIAQSFMENMIIPILNIDLNGDGIKDKQHIENYKIKLFGSEFKLGKFLISILKFALMTYIVYIISIIIEKRKFPFFNMF